MILKNKFIIISIFFLFIWLYNDYINPEHYTNNDSESNSQSNSESNSQSNSESNSQSNSGSNNDLQKETLYSYGESESVINKKQLDIYKYLRKNQSEKRERDICGYIKDSVIGSEVISKPVPSRNENVCFINHHHMDNEKYRDINRDIYCNYGATNYQRPSDMDEYDLKLFQYGSPVGMTLQDYVNWLWTYHNKKETHKLQKKHKKNLQRLIQKLPLTYDMIPIELPTNNCGIDSSFDYCKNTYNKPRDYKIRSELKGLRCSNYTDFESNQEFS